jgi:hypothetical protein
MNGRGEGVGWREGEEQDEGEGGGRMEEREGAG